MTLQQPTFQPFKLSLCFLKYPDRNVFSCTFTFDFETLTPSPTSLLTPAPSLLATNSSLLYSENLVLPVFFILQSKSITSAAILD